jgi:hypothetical protein
MVIDVAGGEQVPWPSPLRASPTVQIYSPFKIRLLRALRLHYTVRDG